MQEYIGQILEELRRSLSALPEGGAEKLAAEILGCRAVFVAGAGRSGLAMKSFAMRLMHLGLNAYVVGETSTPRITDRDLMLIGSGSGSTASLVAHAQKAHSIGALVCLITADEQSPVGRCSDIVVTIPAPAPKSGRDVGFRSIQPLGSLFEQCLMLTLDAIVLALMHRTGVTTGAMLERHANLE